MNSNTFIVRSGRDQDWPELQQAVVKIQEAERALVGDPLKPGNDVPQAYVLQLRDDIQTRQGTLLIAEANADIIGVLAGYVDTPGDPLVAEEFDRSEYVSEMFVHPQWRQKGVATSLLREFERMMRELGLVWATVCVKSKNIAAHRAYQNCGFEDYEVILAKNSDPQMKRERRYETYCAGRPSRGEHPQRDFRTIH